MGKQTDVRGGGGRYTWKLPNDCKQLGGSLFLLISWKIGNIMDICRRRRLSVARDHSWSGKE
jgi:hypothetical protein